MADMRAGRLISAAFDAYAARQRLGPLTRAYNAGKGSPELSAIVVCEIIQQMLDDGILMKGVAWLDVEEE